MLAVVQEAERLATEAQNLVVDTSARLGGMDAGAVGSVMATHHMMQDRLGHVEDLVDVLRRAQGASMAEMEQEILDLAAAAGGAEAGRQEQAAQLARLHDQLRAEQIERSNVAQQMQQLKADLANLEDEAMHSMTESAEMQARLRSDATRHQSHTAAVLIALWRVTRFNQAVETLMAQDAPVLLTVLRDLLCPLGQPCSVLPDPCRPSGHAGLPDVRISVLGVLGNVAAVDEALPVLAEHEKQRGCIVVQTLCRTLQAAADCTDSADGRAAEDTVSLALLTLDNLTRSRQLCQVISEAMLPQEGGLACVVAFLAASTSPDHREAAMQVLHHMADVQGLPATLAAQVLQQCNSSSPLRSSAQALVSKVRR